MHTCKVMILNLNNPVWLLYRSACCNFAPHLMHIITWSHTGIRAIYCVSCEVPFHPFVTNCTPLNVLKRDVLTFCKVTTFSIWIESLLMHWGMAKNNFTTKMNAICKLASLKLRVISVLLVLCPLSECGIKMTHDYSQRNAKSICFH